MKATFLRIIGFAGVLVFGALCPFTFSRPQWVEILLLLIGAFARRDSVDALFVPGVFNQNWLWTISYGSHAGYGYLLGIWLIFLLLLDIVLNRARVTSRIVGDPVFLGNPVFREN